MQPLFLRAALASLEFRPARIVFPYAWVGHIPFARFLIDQAQPKTFVELGTHTGNSFFAFCQAVRESHLATQCFAIDTWLGDPHAGHYSDDVFEDVAAYTHHHYASFATLLRTTFDDARRHFPKHTIDILHIDGLHTYEAVSHDLTTWFDAVKPGGYILFHDTAVRDRDFGVWRLWSELTKRHPYHLHFPHANGLGVLYCDHPDCPPPEWMYPQSAAQKTLITLLVTAGNNLLYHTCYTEEHRLRTQLEQKHREVVAELKNSAEALFAEKIELQHQINRMAGQIATLENHLTAIRNSRSWKITRPLRASARILRAVMNGDYPALKENLRAIAHRIPPLYRLYGKTRAWADRLLTHWRERQEQSRTRAWNELAVQRHEPAAITSSIPILDAPPEWPDLDLSVVTHNSARWLPAFFHSLLHQRYPTQKIALYLTDNASQDETRQLLETWIEQHRHTFRAITFTPANNIGFGEAHHRAITAGRAPFILVLNPDLELLPDAITTAVRYALSDSQERVGSWELRQYPYEHPKHYDPVTLETHWSSHAAILLRRSAYQTAGGYEPRLFLYAEDVELSYRLLSHGYHLKYLPEAGVVHHSYETPQQSKPRQRLGNALGNTLIRWRYGTPFQKVAGSLRFVAYLLTALTNRAERQILAQHLKPFVFPARPSPGKGPHPRTYPIDGWDYEVRRQGAFWPTHPANEETLPLVTLIIRTYQGREHYLRAALLTALHQTYPKLEILVSEDGGETQQPLVAALAQALPPGKTLRHIANPKRGRSAAANAALRAASGHYCLFLDDDDLLYADHIQTLVEALQQTPHAVAAYALAFELPTTPDPASPLGYRETLPFTPPRLEQPWNYDVLKDHNYIPIQSLLFAHALYRERGGMDETLDQLEDWNLWLRYGADHTFLYIPKTTSLYRTPADPAERYRRQLNLHHAYHRAKKRALMLE
ncbi:glycosyltransferase [Hydrogenophilus thiooxidans]|uniref:glycosyltransferase n=1 Tax=Hydrogenophilus thiooxidans TaxID=2820326 RepID=UPI001C22B2A1|nr:glycosyltransferase [Hydrogenophilus thiooxidans]